MRRAKGTRGESGSLALPQNAASIGWSGSSDTTDWKQRYNRKGESRIGSELGKSSSSKRAILTGSISIRASEVIASPAAWVPACAGTAEHDARSYRSGGKGQQGRR